MQSRHVLSPISMTTIDRDAPTERKNVRTSKTRTRVPDRRTAKETLCMNLKLKELKKNSQRLQEASLRESLSEVPRINIFVSQQFHSKIAYFQEAQSCPKCHTEGETKEVCPSQNPPPFLSPRLGERGVEHWRSQKGASLKLSRPLWKIGANILAIGCQSGSGYTKQ